jgi:hypothetical protein
MSYIVCSIHYAPHSNDVKEKSGAGGRTPVLAARNWKQLNAERVRACGQDAEGHRVVKRLRQNKAWASGVGGRGHVILGPDT